MKLEAEDIRVITNAARVVKRSIPSYHALTVADLVSFGAEHVLRYLQGRQARHGLIFACAKNGMLCALKAWNRRNSHTGWKPAMVHWESDWSNGPTMELKGHTPRPPIEEMIDLKNTLTERLSKDEGSVWNRYNVHGESQVGIAREAGISKITVMRWNKNAQSMIERVWDGSWVKPPSLEEQERDERLASEAEARKTAERARRNRLKRKALTGVEGCRSV